jgi:predicted nucleotidyltransferase
MELIKQHKATIESLCRQHKVSKLYAFGSVLSDQFGEESDVDLLVDFAGVDLKHYADNYFSFKFALEKTFLRPVDLVEERAIRNPFFKQSIQARCQLLYAA